MADIAPIQPLRYAFEQLSQLVAPPYDVIDPGLRQKLGARDPHNVVHIDLPEGEGDLRYQIARQRFSEWQAAGVLKRDERPAFWRYIQTFDPPGGGPARTRKGFFALVRVARFEERVILPHEHTLSAPKLDRLALSRATRATLSPIFLLYSDPHRLLDAQLDGGEHAADFSTDDGVQHRVERVTGALAVVHVANALASSRLLIADGHHRYETALTLAEEIDREARASGKNPSERGEHWYVPALLANEDDPGLLVFPTHRLVRSLSGFDFDEFCRRAAELYVVTPLSAGVNELGAALLTQPAAALCAVASNGRAALLRPRTDVDLGAHPWLSKRAPIVRTTSVALLHDGLLEAVLGLGVEAQASSAHLQYVQDAREAARAVNAGQADLLFLMNPTPVSTIRAVAEASEVMPPKSTFFYPKVPTGLLFHTLDPEREVS